MFVDVVAVGRRDDSTPYEMILAMIVCNLLLYAVVTPILGGGGTITTRKTKKDWKCWFLKLGDGFFKKYPQW
jgi:hypothetical protein